VALSNIRALLSSAPVATSRPSGLKCYATGLLNGDVQLQAPPEAISPMAIVPDVLTDAWSNGTATALSISVALSKKAGKPLPWAPVRDAIDGAIRTRVLERTEDSGAWPSDYSNSKNVRLQRRRMCHRRPHHRRPHPSLASWWPGPSCEQTRSRTSRIKSATSLWPPQDWISSTTSRSKSLERTPVRRMLSQS